MFRRKFALFMAMIMLLSVLSAFAEIPPEIPVPELTGMGVDDTNSTEIDAYKKGYAAYVNAYFIDSQQTTYSRDIGRMGALGIVHKKGDMNFNAGNSITKQDLVEYLVRMSGREGQVMQGVINQAGGMGDAAVENLTKQAYVDDAIGQGLITAEEAFGLNQPVDKETTAVWIARMLGLQATLQNTDNIYSFGDWPAITPSNRGLVETMITEQIMAVDNDGNFNPKREITRGEVAYILNSTIDRMYGALGVTSNVGLVIGEKTSNVQETGNIIDEKRFVVRNMDGTLTTIVTKDNKSNNARNDFVLFKNGIVNLSKALKTGDQIEYLIRDGEVIFAEVYDDGSIQEQIKRQSDYATDTNIYYGYISKKIKEEKTENGNAFEVDRLRTTIYNGLVFDIVVDNNLNTGIRNDIIVYKDGNIGGVDLLEEQDVVEMLVQNEENIIYVRVTEPSQGQVSGTVRFVTTDQETGTSMVTIFDYSDQIKKYEVTNYAEIVINHEIANISDLKYGQDVVLSITNGYVTKISGETFINPGFIPDYSKMRIGIVSYVDDYGNMKVKYDDGVYETVKTENTATVIKGGNVINVRAIMPGDNVKIYFNDIYSKQASLIEVEGKEQLIQTVYRGYIQDVNVYRGEITIVEPAILNNAQWMTEDQPYSKTFELDDEIPMYVRGEQITITDLSKLYRQKPVYLAIRDDYSIEKVMQVSVAVGGEHFAIDRIESIDKVIANFELEDNNRNVAYNEGTIFLKNSRLVDPSNIDEKDDVIVVSDYYKGQDNANIVRITSDAERIFDNIYIGAIENVYGYTFNLKNHATISGNEWGDVSESKSGMFYYFNNLDIIDITDKTDFKTLPSYNFYHGGYSRLENENKTGPGLDYYRYYTFFVTDDDRKVIGMNIRHKALLDGQKLDTVETKESEIKKELDKRLAGLVLTRGSIVEFNDTYQRIIITDSHDWAEDYGRWNANKANSAVEYRDAIIIKNDKRIEREDLKEGDYIYVLRDDEDALVIFVEEN
ncbi:S-layer homology domain-containing protein [Acidaminobacter sp. JC074]|uniref:S-layer homology domain-containing protein n=1 Tax=Acidaminobacter sp. JC074 TaxID=2530199 RepID=UPI001F0FF68E|nr:S-layer homology domain-containing protein [Acidaminobacter sp. JC074]MCH4887069.1 S-layer homology domain-containing protein [Acidaminobacter sp. JC074]